MAKEFDLTVYYLSDNGLKNNFDTGFGKIIKWDTPLLEGYRYHFIRNYSWRKSLTNHFFDLINPGVISTLIKDKSSVIIVNGWSYFSIILIIIFAKIKAKKIWLRAENPLNQELKKHPNLIFIKKIFLKGMLFKFIDRYLYIGTENKNFFKFYGAKESDLIFTPYAVDNTFFRERFEKLRERKHETKSEMGLPENCKVVLFVGKYIQKKRPLDLINAFIRIDLPNVYLIMVGEGSMRGGMEKLINDSKFSSNIVLTGFVNQSEISSYYSVADVFVMCSGIGETWGLAVNEAMNFQLPIVVTDICGCATDLVVDGKNGFKIADSDVGKLSESLNLLLGDDNFRSKASLESTRLIDEYSNKKVVMNLKAGMENLK